MRVLDQLSKTLWVGGLLILMIPVAWAEKTSALVVQRPQDELLLPPYLKDARGGILNVRADQLKDQRDWRAVKTGEWLDYGDSFSMPNRLGVQVLMNEGLQWVAGGGFKGKITGGKWNTSQTAFGLEIEWGWIRIWSKSTPFSSPVRIKSRNLEFNLIDGEVLIHVNQKRSEVYVLSGGINGNRFRCEAGEYCQMTEEKPNELKVSKTWNLVTIEEQIAALYPDYIKLVRQAEAEWLDEQTFKKYAEMREKGWGKKDRHFPSPAPKK